MKISERQLRRLISEEVRAYKRGTISELGFLKKIFGRGGAEATAEEPAEDAAKSKVWPPTVNMPTSNNLETLGGLTSLQNNGTIIDLAIKRNLITLQETLMADDPTRTKEIALKNYNEAIKAMTTQIDQLIKDKMFSDSPTSFAGAAAKDLIHQSLSGKKVVRSKVPTDEIQSLLNKIFPQGNSLGQKIYTYAVFRLVHSVVNNEKAASYKEEADYYYNNGLKLYLNYCKGELDKGALAKIFGDESLDNPPYDVKNMLFSHLQSLDFKSLETLMKPIVKHIKESATTKKDQLIFERWQQMAGLLRG